MVTSSRLPRHMTIMLLVVGSCCLGWYMFHIQYFHDLLYKQAMLRHIDFKNFIFNGFINQATKSAIIDSLRSLCISGYECSLEELAEKIRHQFPVIKQITLSQAMGQNNSVEITCSQPLALVNQSYVLTNDHHYLASSYFENDLGKDLPYIHHNIEQLFDHALTLKLSTLLQQLPHFLKPCKITMHDTTSSIILVPDKTPHNIRHRYIMRLGVPLPSRFEDIIAHITSDLYKRRIKNLQASCPILQFDLRFKKKIIVKVLPMPQETKHGS